MCVFVCVCEGGDIDFVLSIRGRTDEKEVLATGGGITIMHPVEVIHGCNKLAATN